MTKTINGYEIGPGANLSRANLIGANLSEANLKGADLERANLNRAYCIGANFLEANLKNANLDGMIIDDGKGNEYVLVGNSKGESIENIIKEINNKNG